MTDDTLQKIRAVVREELQRERQFQTGMLRKMFDCLWHAFGVFKAEVSKLIEK